MTREQIEEKYSEQFKNCFDFSIGPGWLFLIENLCYHAYLYEKRLRDSLKYAEKWKDDKGSAWFGRYNEIKEKIDNLNANPFGWVQIKSKFGGLRAYSYGASPEIQSMIDFAESISFDICEQCGSPSTHQTKGWIAYLCLPCAEKSGQKFAEKSGS